VRGRGRRILREKQQKQDNDDIIIKLIQAIILEEKELAFLHLHLNLNLHLQHLVTVAVSARTASPSDGSSTLSLTPAGPCGAFLLAEGNGSELALRAAVAEEK
jgi:hypothetical protein